MKTFATAAALLLLAAPALADDLGAHKQEGAGVIKAFFGQMKSELEAGMANGGPVTAIDVCNEKAPAIAAANSTKGWTVGRTSQKLRNPDNAPDAWEARVLAEFEARRNAGESPDTLVAATVVESGGVKTFRLMKAIPTGNLCLECHGSDIKPDVEARIAKLYPADQARGYRLNDLRGAFTLEKRL